MTEDSENEKPKLPSEFLAKYGKPKVVATGGWHPPKPPPLTQGDFLAIYGKPPKPKPITAEEVAAIRKKLADMSLRQEEFGRTLRRVGEKFAAREPDHESSFWDE